MNILLLLIGAAAIQAQYSTYYASYADSQRDGHVVPAELTWREDAMNTWMKNHNKTQVPILIFSHGLLSQGSWFGFLAKTLADEGYVFATMMDYQNIDISDPVHYALDLSLLLQEIPIDPKCPISGKIDQTSAAVGGHSEGGAGSFIASNSSNLPSNYKYSGHFKAAVTFSGCYATQMDIVKKSVANDYIPFLVLAATLDCLCGDKLEHELYTLMGSQCKYYVDIINGSHCLFDDAPEVFQEACMLVENAQNFCHDGHTLLHGSAQRALAVRYVKNFLEWAIGGDGNSAKSNFEGIVKTDTTKGVITSILGC